MPGLGDHELQYNLPIETMDTQLVELRSQSIFVCDMAPGFTQNGVELNLPAGTYAVSLIEASHLFGVEFLLQESTVDMVQAAGNISIDGAAVGVFDINGFLMHFDGDFESIYHWSSEIVQHPEKGIDISHEHAGKAYYFQTKGDCDSEVVTLHSNGKVVGFRVLPIIVGKEDSAERSWTWIEFRCAGLSQDFSICHNRDYPNEIDDVLDSVLSDLCTIESEDEILAFIDEDEVDIDLPIKNYRAEFSGLSSVKVYLETSLNGDSVRRPIHPIITNIVETIDKQSSTKDLALCMFKIFERSLNLA